MQTNTVIDGVDYGPLAALIGHWEGDKGSDLSPEPQGEEKTPYYEKLVIEAIGEVKNAERQTLAVLHYHQWVHRKSNGTIFHNECGYWMWDKQQGQIIKSLTIPRGVAVVAGGKVTGEQASEGIIVVEAAQNNQTFSIIQQPFMQDNANTEYYRQELSISDQGLSYRQSMRLSIYGKTFDHTDENLLTRVDI